MSEERWIDTTIPSPDDIATKWGEGTAVDIQLARDAVEERRAWVRFVAAMSTIVLPSMTTPEEAADFLYGSADRMLKQYRARFGYVALCVEEKPTP